MDRGGPNPFALEHNLWRSVRKPSIRSPPIRALHDALMVVKRMLESNVLVAGGGAVETALSIYLDSFATTVGSREQLAIAEFAEALLVIPKTLAINAAQVTCCSIPFFFFSCFFVCAARLLYFVRATDGSVQDVVRYSSKYRCSISAVRGLNRWFRMSTPFLRCPAGCVIHGRFLIPLCHIYDRANLRLVVRKRPLRLDVHSSRYSTNVQYHSAGGKLFSTVCP